MTFSCALYDDGQVRCWGAFDSPPGDTHRILAVGGSSYCTINSESRVTCYNRRGEDLHLTLPSAKSLAVYSDSVCVVSLDDSLVCSGPISEWAPPDGAFRRLSLGRTNACAERLSGGIVCWGRSARSPTNQLGLHDVEAKDGYACALDLTNKLRCWGYERSIRTLPHSRYVEVAVGRHEVCARRPDGSLACFFRSDHSRSIRESLDRLAPGQHYVNLRGGESICAFTSDGGVRCSMSQAYCSDRDAFSCAISTLTPRLEDISPKGAELSCEVRSDGRLYCDGFPEPGPHVSLVSPPPTEKGADVVRETQRRN